MSIEITDAEKLCKEGKAEYKKGNFLAAAKAFTAAQSGYETADQMLMAAEMANNASVAYLQAGEAEAAFKAVEGTGEIFKQHGSLSCQGMAAGNRAAALEALDRLDEAVHDYEISIDLLKKAGEDDLLASVSQSLSALQLRMGRQLEAVATIQSGLEGIKKPSPSQRMLKRLIKVPFELLNKKR
jgi:tetratricopeptide (TPR) repeat protein